MTRTSDPATMVEAATHGDRVALARLISLVERGGEAARIVGRLTFPLGGRAYSVGITGAPGAGKSTLTDRLLTEVRAGGGDVAVLAIDPSSPFSGGAILGDRVRMQDHALDDGVFIRSMASRGHLGGLSLAVPEAIRVLDAAGLPVVIVETVGVGQVEIEVAETADTTVVVVNPGWGDSVQANKAGLLEIADVFVINKADRPGAAETRRDLEMMLMMGDQQRAWTPPIVLTSATSGDGVADLWAAIGEHRQHITHGGELDRRRRHRLEQEVRSIVTRRLEEQAYALCAGDAFVALLDEVADRRRDPYAAAASIVERA